MVALLLPSMVASFLLHSRVPFSRVAVHSTVRTPAAVAFHSHADEAFSSMINRLESNVLNESGWEEAHTLARLWLEAEVPSLSRATEAEQLAMDSPRFARWLKAHGYLSSLLPLPVRSSSVSITEEEDAYTVTIAGLQGVDAADCEVAVSEDGMLRVQGETTVLTPDGASRSSFSRSYPIPWDADRDVVSTSREDDAIIVSLPKTGEALAGGDELIAEVAVTEAEQLAADSPRFARWLKAHGYLSDERTDEAAMA